MSVHGREEARRRGGASPLTRRPVTGNERPTTGSREPPAFTERRPRAATPGREGRRGGSRLRTSVVSGGSAAAGGALPGGHRAAFNAVRYFYLFICLF